jgi:type II secretory pathway pseudopilin PulG
MTGQTKVAAQQRAMTLLEALVAMVIVVLVFAAVVPQLRSIQNSWASKRENTEIIQNGRVLIDHIVSSLAQAGRVTAVSDSTRADGFIEFEDRDGNTMRYQIDANDNYVVFGPVNELAGLAGPVNELRFACYDACDLDTPITDVNQIRTVTVQVVFNNPSQLGRQHFFTAQAYLRTNKSNSDDSSTVSETPGSTFEFDVFLAVAPAVTQIDSAHYLCAYTGTGDDGWAVVLQVDTEAAAIEKAEPFEFDNDKGVAPALTEIDDTHYICAYTGPGDYGWAVVLTVNAGNWSVTRQTPFEFDTEKGCDVSLLRLDDTHYLCAYSGAGDDGWSVVLTVNTSNWSITKEIPFEFDTQKAAGPALAEIDDTHYLCAYADKFDDGQAVVLTVNTVNWSITQGSPFEFEIVKAQTPALTQIDAAHYLCAYTGHQNQGYVTVLSVNPSSWEIAGESVLVYETGKAIAPALVAIDSNHFLCAYEGANIDGWANVLTVDADNWMVSTGRAVEFDPVGGETSCLAKIDDTYYLCIYQGGNNDGWAVILQLGAPIVP